MEMYSSSVALQLVVVLTVFLSPTFLAGQPGEPPGEQAGEQTTAPLPEAGKPSSTTTASSSAEDTTSRVPIPPGVEGVPNFVVYKGGIICLRVMMNAQLVIHYQAHDDLRPTRQLEGKITLPSTAVASGNCSPKKSSLILSWENNTLALTFTPVISDHVDQKFSVAMWAASKVTFRFDASRNSSVFPGIKKDHEYVAQTPVKELHFQTPANFSYTCAAQEDMSLFVYTANRTRDTTVIQDVQLSVWDTKIQAFQLAPAGTYSEPAVCKPDIEAQLPKQNIIPLAVAACLAGLILIIVVIYFFVKNRTQSFYRAMD